MRSRIDGAASWLFVGAGPPLRFFVKVGTTSSTVPQVRVRSLDANLALRNIRGGRRTHPFPRPRKKVGARFAIWARNPRFRFLRMTE